MNNLLLATYHAKISLYSQGQRGCTNFNGHVSPISNPNWIKFVTVFEAPNVYFSMKQVSLKNSLWAKGHPLIIIEKIKTSSSLSSF